MHTQSSLNALTVAQLKTLVDATGLYKLKSKALKQEYINCLMEHQTAETEQAASRARLSSIKEVWMANREAARQDRTGNLAANDELMIDKIHGKPGPGKSAVVVEQPQQRQQVFNRAQRRAIQSRQRRGAQERIRNVA